MQGVQAVETPRQAGRERIVLKKPTQSIVFAACLAALLAAMPALTGCDTLLDKLNPPRVIHPQIVPSSAEDGSDTVTTEFPFEDGTVKVSVPIERSVYAGAVDAEKRMVFVGEKPADWVPDYYRAFIDEEHQSAFYESLLGALRDIRAQEGLDDSQYAELITSLAQNLEYRTGSGSLAPKFPIETLGDEYGDCDDKALLAAALLSREGYDVAILLFQPEKHVALGIRAPGLDYKDTGYAYVEMTEPSLIGIPVEHLAEGYLLQSQPKVIPIGDGEKAYLAGEQVSYIQQRLEDIAAERERLHGESAAEGAEIKELKAALESELQALKKITDAKSLTSAVKRYNDRVATYNALAKELNELAARYNGLVEVEKYVAEHQSSRPQVYERLRAVKL